MKVIAYLIRPVIALLLVTVWSMSSLKAQEDNPDNDLIEFAFLTDTHAYGQSADIREAKPNIKAFVEYCRQTPSLQFALFGGDFICSYETNHAEALAALKQSQQDFAGLNIPLYTTKGNHDCNGKQHKANGQPDNSQIVTDREYYELFHPLSESNPLANGKDIVVDPENPYGNYYYRDFEDKRFRLIVLNDYDRDSLEVFGYHGLQMKWLAEKALDFEDKKNPEEWLFVILGHYISVDMYQYPISRLIYAYIKGEDFEDSDSGIHYFKPFHKMRRAQLVAMICGHQHDDYFDNTSGYNIINVQRGFATGGEVGTADLAFDHFVIDRKQGTIMEHRIGRGSSRLFSYDPVRQLSPVEAFPEARGNGRYTCGGNGGRVIRVTNLKDSGKGSLRWAVSQTGARHVIFDVAGNIELKSPLVIAADSLTLSGHSAPGEGITLQGAPVVISASQVIMRHLRIRPGESKKAGWPKDAISDTDWSQHHIVLDHLSVSWAEGSCIALRHANQCTVERCLLANTFGDAPGLLAGGVENTYNKNVVMNHRNGIMFPEEEGQNRWIHLFQNIVFNWGDHAFYGGGRQGEITLESNYCIPGTASRNRDKILDVAEDGTGRYYLSWNQLYGKEQFTLRNQELVNDRPGLAYLPSPADTLDRVRMTPLARPIAISNASTCITKAAFHYRPIFDWQPFDQLLRDLTLDAGCSLERDSYDLELAEQLREMQRYGVPRYDENARDNGLITSMKETGGWPKLTKQKLADRQLNDLEEELNRKAELRKSIIILFENDVHCHIEGYPKLAGYRDAISSDTAYVGITSGGDFSNGNIIGALSGGKNILDLMGSVRYDAILMGNDEWMHNIDSTKKMFSKQLPVITCCNVRDNATQTPVYNPYVMHQYGKTKVAFIGVVSPHTLSSRHFFFSDAKGNLAYNFAENELYSYVQTVVDDARAHGADYVIVLTTLADGTQRTALTTRDLIANTTGIDAVLDGFRHNPMIQYTGNRDGHSVLHARTGRDFNNIGKLIISPDGRISAELIATNLLQFKNRPVLQLIDSIQTVIGQYANTPIGKSEFCVQLNESEGELYERNIRQVETPMGDLVADAYRWSTGADICLINAGAIRDSLQAGTLTRGDLHSAMPLHGYVQLVSITGRQLQHALDVMASLSPNNIGTFFQASGIRYTMIQEQECNHVEILDRNTQEYVRLNPDKTYTLATSDYVLHDPYYRGVFEHCTPLKKDIMAQHEPLFRYVIEALKGTITQEYRHSQRRITIK